VATILRLFGGLALFAALFLFGGPGLQTAGSRWYGSQFGLTETLLALLVLLISVDLCVRGAQRRTPTRREEREAQRRETSL
jgi:hypothetical protein